jgi:hypothetical protein
MRGTHAIGADPRAIITEAEERLAEATALRERQLELEAVLKKRLAALGRPRTAEAQAESRKLTESIAQLRGGVSRDDGAWFPEVAGFAGRPGIDANERIIEDLTRELEGLRARAADWPEGVTARPFRYTGPAFKMRMDGREIEPGEVVLLNESQARSFGDRFEPVTSEPVTTEVTS